MNQIDRRLGLWNFPFAEESAGVAFIADESGKADNRGLEVPVNSKQVFNLIKWVVAVFCTI